MPPASASAETPNLTSGELKKNRKQKLKINSTFLLAEGFEIILARPTERPGQNIQMDILPGASRFFWSPPFYLSDGSGRDLSALSVASRSPAVFLANLELKFADAMFAAAILENVRA